MSARQREGLATGAPVQGSAVKTVSYLWQPVAHPVGILCVSVCFSGILVQL